MKAGILGLGKMGEAIAQGLARSHRFELQATTRSESSAEEAFKRLAIRCHTDNEKLATSSDIIILCVKPQQAEKILQSLAPKFRSNQLLISVCASLTTQQLTEWTDGTIPVIRAMPNTPCLVGKGMTVFCGGEGVPKASIELAQSIFDTLGKTIQIEESLMDGATGLSGCGPAFVYLMIEALSEAGVKVGLSRPVSTLLASQTLAGAAEMVLTRGIHPAALKDEVTTPAGCTIDGLMALEEGKLRVTLIKAVLASAKRSKSLREKTS